MANFVPGNMRSHSKQLGILIGQTKSVDLIRQMCFNAAFFMRLPFLGACTRMSALYCFKRSILIDSKNAVLFARYAKSAVPKPMIAEIVVVTTYSQLPCRT